MKQQKSPTLLPLLLLFLLTLYSCMKDEVGGVRIVTDEKQTVYSVPQQSVPIGFYAGGDWTATTTANWLQLLPDHGEGGRANTLVAATTALNRTKAVRSALVSITSGGMTQTVTITQSDEYAVFSCDTLDMTAEGGKINVGFETNAPDSLRLYVSSTLGEYLVNERDSAAKAAGSRVMTQTAKSRAATFTSRLDWLRLLPNTTSYARSGILLLAIHDKKGLRLDLDTLHIRQAGAFEEK